MKKYILLSFLLIYTVVVKAQKVSYKDQIILVDDKAIATITKQSNKDAMGLVSDYEIYNMQKQLLIIAAYATDFPDEKDDDLSYHYKLTFVGLDKTGYFKISKLGPEKSLAKLIGNGGIIKDDKLENDALFKFIAKNGKVPPTRPVEYVLVERDRNWPIEMIKRDTIEQQNKFIGNYRDVTPSGSNVDYYQFSLPNALVVANVNFQNGNNAQECEITTIKDNRKRIVAIPTDEKTLAMLTSVDRNLVVLKRIVKWLVLNSYL